MARIQKDARLQSRDSRARLPKSPQPYWRTIHPGLALGYYKGEHGGIWYVRRRVGKRYAVARLAEADDLVDADGDSVLGFEQAQRRALEPDTSGSRTSRKSAKTYTVAEALSDWQRAHHAKSRSDASSTVSAQVRLLAEELGSTPIARLTTRAIETWRDQHASSPPRLRRGRGRDGKPAPVRYAATPKDIDPREAKRRRQATANRLLNVLKAALNHAWRAGLAESDQAWRRVGRFAKVDQPRLRFLSVDECRQLLDVCPQDFGVLVHAALNTGLRLGELISLRVGDVREGCVFVQQTKSGKARTIPLSDAGLSFFEELCSGREKSSVLFRQADGQPWYKMRISRLMREANQEARLDPPAHFHDLRRSYGSLLINAGASGEVIQKLLGHSDMRMTLRVYAHLLDTRIAEQVRSKLPAFA